jgi:toxin ParE1/3/4
VTYRLLPQAIRDIEGIVLTIAVDNPVAARHWFDRLHKTFSSLGAMPEMGSPRFDVRPDMRLFPIGRYLILYRAADAVAEIVRVIHGAREWEDLV